MILNDLNNEQQYLYKTKQNQSELDMETQIFVPFLNNIFQETILELGLRIIKPN
jgi:hypothetical protein